MNRTDVVQRSDISSHNKEKHVEHHLTLIQREETLLCAIELLLETLADLSEWELKDFKVSLLSQRYLYKPEFKMLMLADTQETVFFMAQTFGRQSTNVTMEVLNKMNRRDLVQRLSGNSSAPKKKNSVDEHLSALIHQVATMGAVRELLLETLNVLGSQELNDFKWILQFLEFKRGLQFIPWIQVKLTESTAVLVDLMVETYGRQSVEVTKEVFVEMKRTDLVQRLSEASSGPKVKHSVDEQWPALVEKVETMIELLLETLADMSGWMLESFKQVLQKYFTRWQFDFLGRLLKITNKQDTVLIIAQIYGQQSVKVTKKILKDMNRLDLVRRLSGCSSRHKKKHHVDKRLSTLIHKVATIAAAKEMLLETLNRLSYRELEKFIEGLRSIVFQEDLADGSLTWSSSADSTDVVDLMLNTYGQRCVELTKKVFEEMNRSDVVERSDASSRSTKKQSADKHQPAKKVKPNVKLILLETLNELNQMDLMKFKWLLQLTHFQKSLEQMSQSQLTSADRADLVDLMVQTGGQQCVDVAKEIFTDMNRTDLVLRLSDTRKKVRAKHRPSLRQQKVSITQVKEKLLDTLEELSFKEFLQFKEVVQKLPKKKNFQRVRMEMADKFNVVDLMVKIYGQQSVEVTREVLMKMNRKDLMRSLSDTSSGSREFSRSSAFEARRSVVESSYWIKLEPEVNSDETDEAPTYSLQSEAGKFECSVSGLRWVSNDTVGFKYQFLSWEKHMDRIESLQYMPAGPLLDITVTAGKLNEVYLPHWICTDDNPKILDMFAVLHIDSCGDVVEDASEVTSSHVKLTETVFSPRAALMKIGIPVKIKCNMLIYKTNTAFLTLHVYLIPRDPGLGQEMDRRELSYGYKVIRKPHPEKSLKMNDCFILTTNLDRAEIYPETLKLRYESRNPNYFEVFVENPDRNFKLNLTVGKERESVWTCVIRKDEYQNTGHIKAVRSSSGATGRSTLTEGRFTDEHMIDKLSLMVQKVVTVTTVREKLLEMLQCLSQEEFREFKWFLQSRSLIKADLPCIPWSKLEKAHMLDVVDLIEQTYDQQAVEVTKVLFKKINRNDLVMLL
ncbi:hypothetical protein PAMA_015494 [Pampus argenteus]